MLYSWDSDVRDALAVLDSTTRSPVPFVGHSKGGSVVMQMAEAMPHRCTHLVNLDGLPSRRSWPDVPDHERALLAGELRAWLDHRASASSKERKTGSIDDLARRRQRMNPRLTLDWLRYLVTIGARGRAGRVPVEARSDHALRRVRPVAPGVVDDADARPRHAGAGRARPHQ